MYATTVHRIFVTAVFRKDIQKIEISNKENPYFKVFGMAKCQYCALYCYFAKALAKKSI